MQVNESAGELYQPLVERTVWTFLLWQPHFLQNIVGLVKKLPIEAVEVRQVMRVEIASLKLFDDDRDFRALMAHPQKLRHVSRGPKRKILSKLKRIAPGIDGHSGEDEKLAWAGAFAGSFDHEGAAIRKQYATTHLIGGQVNALKPFAANAQANGLAHDSRA